MLLYKKKKIVTLKKYKIVMSVWFDFLGSRKFVWHVSYSEHFAQTSISTQCGKHHRNNVGHFFNFIWMTMSFLSLSKQLIILLYCRWCLAVFLVSGFVYFLFPITWCFQLSNDWICFVLWFCVTSSWLLECWCFFLTPIDIILWFINRVLWFPSLW